jgi:mannose-6-phosphate isomerase-like protein (cupin superfamily)
MNVSSIASAEPFTTKDGSTIRELHHTAEQSLAEASLPAGAETQRHHHALTEEIYVVLEGTAMMEVDGSRRSVGPGDAILIPAGARHQISAETALRFLCCCVPPYSDEDTYFDEPSLDSEVAAR